MSIRLLLLVTLLSALLAPATPPPSRTGAPEVRATTAPLATKAVARILEVSVGKAPQREPVRPSPPTPALRRPRGLPLLASATIDRVPVTAPPAVVHDARRAIRRSRPARHVPRRGDDDPAAT